MAKVKNHTSSGAEIKNFAQLLKEGRENHIELSDDMTTRLEFILNEFEGIGVNPGQSLDCLIGLGLIRCGHWTNAFIDYSNFMQNTICKNDEKLKFKVQNANAYSKNLYSSNRVYDYIELTKQYEKGAYIEEFKIFLSGDTMILLEYNAKIFEEIFDYCPAILLERAIILSIETIENSFKRGNSPKKVYETMEAWLLQSTVGVLVMDKVYCADVDNYFNKCVERGLADEN